jgi:hypothetical protein
MWEIGDRVVVTKAPGRTIVAKLGYKGTVIDRFKGNYNYCRLVWY